MSTSVSLKLTSGGSPARLCPVQRRPPTRIWAVVFAVLAGVLLAVGHVVAGLVLTVLAIACMWA